MSNIEQLQKNISTFSENKPLNEQELDALLDIADEMTTKIALPCTACQYCANDCPKKLDIPNLLELYNEHCFTVNAGLMAFIAPMALMAISEDKRPKACTACKKCEAVCPQNIKISDAMADFAAKLG
jgi:predicted aldo/keto reductase-like oxidoreductase